VGLKKTSHFSNKNYKNENIEKGSSWMLINLIKIEFIASL
jgi:hypothetical protein